MGSEVIEKLFGKSDPLGDKIKVNGINFEVIGVLKSKGDRGWHNPDDQIIVPYTTAMKQLFGLKYFQEIDIQLMKYPSSTKFKKRLKPYLDAPIA